MFHRHQALAASVLLMGSVVACGPSSEPTPSEPRLSVQRRSVTSTRIAPTWERTNQYFIKPVPYFTYYANDPASADWTWTTAAWNCPSNNPPPGDSLFCTADKATTNDEPRPGTHFWFRTRIKLCDLNGLRRLVLEDKYRPDRLLLNDGVVVFVNGKPQTGWTPSVALGKNYPSNLGMTYDPTASTEWTFDAHSIPLTDLKEGDNEIAILFEERHGNGGLGHLVLKEERDSVATYPAWERTTTAFLEDFPYLTHYARDSRTETWTGNAWDGPQYNTDGLLIPGYVANDTWFSTPDLGDGQKSTYHWFRTTLEVSQLAQLQALLMYDKYSPTNRRLAVNEGMIVFVNGVPLTQRMPNVTLGGNNPLYGTGLTRDTSSSTGWTFDTYAIPPSSLCGGRNEIAVLFGERHGAGGLGHLVLETRNLAP
jgi:hypothetical protein